MKVIPVMNYATPQVAKAEARQDSTSFGALQPATMAKSHRGGKIGLALAVPALALAAVFAFSSCANPVSGDTKTEETDPTKPENPVKPSQSPVSTALQSIFNVLKVGGSSSGASASLISKSVAYSPVSGDVTAFSYHDDFGGCTASYTLDKSKSTSDALVYDSKSVDDIFLIENKGVCTVTKTDRGVKYTDQSGVASEYVAKDGYVMVYLTRDGVTTEFERQYPGDAPNTVRITAPDGGDPGDASTLSKYSVTYAQ